MAESILSILSRPNAVLDPSGLRSGPNHESGGIVIESWDHWPQFNFKDLYAKFQAVLEAEWRSPPVIPRISGINSRIIDEETFEHQVLSTDIIPTVNAALDHARYLTRKKTGLSPAHLSLVRGSWCTYQYDSRYHAHWVLVDPDSLDNIGRPVCLAAGDTKISSKWHNVTSDSAGIAEQAWILPI